MVNYVTDNMVAEGTDLWSLLDLPVGASQGHIDTAWERSEKTIEQRYAWKALRDPDFRRLYMREPSINTLFRAGFFDDGLETPIENWLTYGPKNACTPVHKLKLMDLNESFILITTGAFSPIHNGHVGMMDRARDLLVAQGKDVLGGYFCPGHDSYVSTKNGGTAAIPAGDRIHMAELALADTPWMVDPWAARYAPCELNFTDVIRRLKTYLKAYFPYAVRFAYVVGSDNEDFSKAILGSGDICLVMHRTPESSTQVRGGAHDMLHPRVKEYLDASPAKGVYQIRDDKLGSDSLRNQVIELIGNAMSNHPIEILDVDDQRRRATEILGDRQSISMDPFFTGTYNIGLSRIFPLAGSQYSSEAEILPRLSDGRNNTWDLQSIPKGSYVLVEDDVASGTTMNMAKAALAGIGVEISEDLILSNLDTTPADVYDVVDARDFMLGQPFSGLAVKCSRGLRGRAPYMLPFVNLRSRAKIPARKEMQLSLDLWRANAANLDPNITLDQLSGESQVFMVSVGWGLRATLVDFCDFYIRVLEEALEGRCRATV